MEVDAATPLAHFFPLNLYSAWGLSPMGGLWKVMSVSGDLV